MTRLFILCILLVTVVLAPCAGYGAEILKVKLLTAITGDDKEKPVLLKNPSGVTCNDKSVVVVADSDNGRLVRYSFMENVLKGGTEIKIPQLVYPVRVHMNSKGDIYALDGKSRRIVQLNPEGAFASYLEPQGVPAPAVIVPRSFKIAADDTIYLLDILGERILVLNAAGNYVNQLQFPKPYGFFSDLAVNANGDIFLLDSVKATLFVARKNNPTFVPLVKDLKEYLNFAANIAVDYRGVIFLTDQNGGALVAFGQDGALLGRQLSLGWKSGQLFYPTQMCVTQSGVIFIADRSNNRVQIFELTK